MNALPVIPTLAKARKLRRLGPYSCPPPLAALDMRTREGRLLRDTRTELAQHLGGTPSATQRALIERAARLTVRCAQLDAKLTAGTLSEQEHGDHLNWTKALINLLYVLDLKRKDRK